MTRRRHLLTATAVATDGDALLEVYATTGYLADAVALGLLPGESTPLQVGTAPLPESPAHALDADEAGVTLLRVRDGETTAVHVALPGAGRLDHSPRHAWRRLLDAIPARVAHP